MFSDQLRQSLPRDSRQRGGPGHVALGLVEGSFQVASFERVVRRAAGTFPWVHLVGSIRDEGVFARSWGETDDLLGRDEQATDRRAKPAHVARPSVIPEHVP